MQGRYGVDQLSKALLVIGLISVLLASFFRGSLIGTFFYYVGWFLIIYCYFRMFSKNVSKRYAENQAYLAKSYKIRCFFAKQKDLFRQRKQYHIYKCPGCSQKIRIPRGKGKIEIRITCHYLLLLCGTKFIKRAEKVQAECGKADSGKRE